MVETITGKRNPLTTVKTVGYENKINKH